MSSLGKFGRKAPVAIAVLAVAIISASYFGYQHFSGLRVAAERCEIVTKRLADDGKTPTITQGSHAVTIVGDSYTSGDQMPDRTQTWARHVGQAKGWSVTTAAVSFTGYLNDGYCGNQQFSERTAEVLATQPEMVIIEGGLNDFESSATDVQAAAETMVTALESVPHIVLIGPVNVPSRDGEAAIDQALSAAAASRDVQYISAIDWELKFAPDQLHMLPEGHIRYAELVGAELGGLD